MSDEHDKRSVRDRQMLAELLCPHEPKTVQMNVAASEIRRCYAELDSLRAELAERAAFKAYVHERLDTAGVPHDPDPEKTADTGCRIGHRLDWLLAERDASPRPAVPEGWKLVPVKPTPEMLHAAAERRYVWEKGGTAGTMEAMAYYNCSVRPHSDYMERAFLEEWKTALTVAPTPPADASGAEYGDYTSHNLARHLLERPDTKITASVDVSTGEHDDLNRAFGCSCDGIQIESDGDITLLFSDGDLNFETSPASSSDASGDGREAGR